MGHLKGKRAFLTGASQGIGAAIAEGLIDAGADVCLHYFQSDATPRRLADKAQGGRAKRAAGSCRPTCAWRPRAAAVVKQATELLGGLDVLINNAGSLVARRKLEEVDVAFWDEVIRINFTTMMFVTRAAQPALVEARASSIVNVASLWRGARVATAARSSIRAPRAAIITWTRQALAAEPRPQRCAA